MPIQIGSDGRLYRDEQHSAIAQSVSQRYGTLIVTVKDSKNPFAWADGSKYILTINRNEKIKVIVGKGISSAQKEIGCGNYSVKLNVYGYQDVSCTESDCSLQTNITITENAITEIVIERGTTFTRRLKYLVRNR